MPLLTVFHYSTCRWICTLC